MSVFGIAGGEMTLSARQVEFEGRPAYKFEMSALSNDVLSKFFLVRDYLVSWADPATFRSLRFEKHTVEGKRVRDERIEFDYERGYAVNGDERVPIEGTTLDALSSVYYLRTLDLEGETPIELRVVSRENSTLRLERQGRERVKTPAGTFQTIRVEPKTTGDSLIGKGKSLVLWLTDDERKVPVQIKSRLKFGTLVGRLKSIERSPPSADDNRP